MTAEFDKRSMILSRDNAREESYVIVGGNAITTGHARWGYFKRENSSVGIVPDYIDTPVDFFALIRARGDNWAEPSDRKWEWKPPGPSDTKTSAVLKITNGKALDNSVGMMDGAPGRSVTPGWYRQPAAGSETMGITYITTDTDGVTATSQYKLVLHNQWENPTPNTAKTWADGSNPGQTHRTESKLLDVARIDGIQKDKTWTYSRLTSTLTTELKAEFGVGFKLGDWFNAGGSFESSSKLEITTEYEANAPLLNLAVGESAIPCVNYIVRTNHKLVDNYDEFGRYPNTARSDGKWEKSADLPVPMNDISPNWQRTDTGVPGNP